MYTQYKFLGLVQCLVFLQDQRPSQKSSYIILTRRISSHIILRFISHHFTPFPNLAVIVLRPFEEYLKTKTFRVVVEVNTMFSSIIMDSMLIMAMRLKTGIQLLSPKICLIKISCNFG